MTVHCICALNDGGRLANFIQCAPYLVLGDAGEPGPARPLSWCPVGGTSARHLEAILSDSLLTRAPNRSYPRSSIPNAGTGHREPEIAL